MDISRIKKANDFTIMCNHHLHNTELSLKAKGLLQRDKCDGNGKIRENFFTVYDRPPETKRTGG